MIPQKFELSDLSVQEIVLFAFRYRLIDDCHPEGNAFRLLLGNQSLLLTQDELTAFLRGLLLQYLRTLDDTPPQTPVWYGRN